MIRLFFTVALGEEALAGTAGFEGPAARDGKNAPCYNTPTIPP